MPARPPLWTLAFAIAFGAHFLHALAFHSFLHLPGFLSEGGVSELGIGLIVATMAGAGIAARPVVGWLTDVRGRRVVLRVGGVLHVLAAAAYLGVSASGPAIYAVRVLHGLSLAALFTVLFTIAADIVPASRRTEGMAVFGVSGMIPMALAGVIGDAVLANGDYPHLFAGAAGAAALATVSAWMLPESRPTRSASGAGPGFFATATASTFRPLWLVGLAFSLCVASYFAFIKTFVLTREIGSVGTFFTGYSITAVVLRIALGWLPDRVGAARMLAPAMLAMAAGVGVLAAAHGDIAVIVAGVLCGAGHAFVFPIVSALVVERSQERERGAALATFTALFDLGLFIGGPLFGLVLAASDYTTMFTLAGVIASGGAVGFVAWERHRARVLARG